MSEYNPALHDDFIECNLCGARNAPESSGSYDSKCYKCNESLRESAVEIGDVVNVDVVDIHENGSGVCRTEEGFVILVDGLLPEEHAKVEVTNIADSQSYAFGKYIETVQSELEWHGDNKDKDSSEKDNRRGARNNFWG